MDAARAAALEESEYAEQLLREMARRRVRHDLDEIEQQKLWVPPETTFTLAEEFAWLDSQPPLQYRIDGLHVAGGNTVLTAQYKTGKTTLLNDLLAGLADGVPFLGQCTSAPYGRIAFWNYEMGRQQFDLWLARRNIATPQRVSLLSLRGQPNPLGSETGRKWAIEWLKDRQVEVLIIDPHARAMLPFGSENSNEDVAQYLDMLDQLKDDAGVLDLFLSCHVGRAPTEQGEERARGATRLDDWADHRWLLTRGAKEDRDERFLMVEGRDVELAESRLIFDASSGRYTGLAGGSRKEAAANRRRTETKRKLLRLIIENVEARLPWGALRDQTGKRGIERIRSELLNASLIRCEDGPNGAQIYLPTDQVLNAGDLWVTLLP